jgi:hypothetical protein
MRQDVTEHARHTEVLRLLNKNKIQLNIGTADSTALKAWRAKYDV